jgi:hypothetical protein
VPVVTISPAASGAACGCSASTRQIHQRQRGAVEHVGADAAIDEPRAMTQRQFEGRQRPPAPRGRPRSPHGRADDQGRVQPERQAIRRLELPSGEVRLTISNPGAIHYRAQDVARVVRMGTVHEAEHNPGSMRGSTMRKRTVAAPSCA